MENDAFYLAGTGERGIRTLGTPEGLNGFRDRPIQPLSHLSKSDEAKWIRTTDLQIRNLTLYPAEL